MRELHALEVTDSLEKAVKKRRKNRDTDPDGSSLTGSSGKKAKGKKQAGLDSFFSRAKKLKPAKKTQSVVILSDTEDDVEPVERKSTVAISNSEIAVVDDVSPTAATKENAVVPTFFDGNDARKRESAGDPPGESPSEKKLRVSS